jgi:HEPN domain-containing protein
MKQTATEFLLINLLNKFPKEMEYLFELDKNLIEDILKEAKEMEKQQIIDAYQHGYNNAYFANPLNKEQYYNETFKN